MASIISLMLTVTSLSGITFALVFAVKWYHSVRSRGKYPPGPPSDFVIGNLRQMPSSYHWLTFAKWAQKYGPLTYLNIAGQPILIINTQEAAIDLLEKRASIYSDRPPLVMIELSGFAEATGFVRIGGMHRKQRKILAQTLHPRVVLRDYVTVQEQFARQFAKSLLDDPDSYVDNIQRLTGEVVQSIAYGGAFDGKVDLVELGKTNMKNVGKVMSGYVVDLLPWLRYIPDWLPGVNFKREAKAIRAIALETRWLPYHMVKKQASSGTAPPSFVLSALEAAKSSQNGELDDDVISAAAMSLFGAGSESTAGTLCTFILAMLLYPEVQKKARAEIDRVVGEDRLPTIASKDNTPYLNAVLLEALRWHPVLPIAPSPWLGIPHRLVQDDVYGGQAIPAGTTVFVNAWGILHDEDRFPDPSTFNPDRFLNMNRSDYNSTDIGGVHDKTMSSINPWDVAFGYGRRICQGIPIVETELWIGMAMILACFEIRPKTDPETKEPLIPKARWTGGSIRQAFHLVPSLQSKHVLMVWSLLAFASFPEPFLCNIVPRSSERAERINEAVQPKFFCAEYPAFKHGHLFTFALYHSNMLLYHIWLVPTLALALLVPPGATGALVGHINRSGSTLHALQVYRLSELGISTDPSPRSARGLTLVIEDLVNNAADPEHSPQLNSMLRTFYQDRLVESPKSANTITQGEVNQVRDKIRAYWASTDPEGAAEVRISKDSPKSSVHAQSHLISLFSSGALFSVF
ncbi:hypothetical protein FRB97_002953 [Tulasnella sp. 331]|nr:hypothetical protein FRB97_002953 [Tulasnella sp. 331]